MRHAEQKERQLSELSKNIEKMEESNQQLTQQLIIMKSKLNEKEDQLIKIEAFLW